MEQLKKLFCVRGLLVFGAYESDFYLVVKFLRQYVLEFYLALQFHYTKGKVNMIKCCVSDHTCGVLVFLQSGDLPIRQQPLAVPEKHPCCRSPYFCLLLRCPGAQSVSSSNLLLCLLRQIRNNNFCQINFASTLFFP